MSKIINVLLVGLVACGEAPRINNLLLKGLDDQSVSYLNMITADVNEAIGCEALAISEDNIIRRTVSVLNVEPNDEYLKKLNVSGLYTSELELIRYFITRTSTGFYTTYTKDGHKSLSEYTVTTVYSEPVILGILLHEVGHAMGLSHEQDSILSEQITYMPYIEAVQSLSYLLYKHNKIQCHPH
jgi:hypothetical protein